MSYSGPDFGSTDAHLVRPVLIEERKSPFSMRKKRGLLCTFRGFYQGGSYGSDQSVVVFQNGDYDFENGDFLSSIRRTGLTVAAAFQRRLVEVEFRGRKRPKIPPSPFIGV